MGLCTIHEMICVLCLHIHELMLYLLVVLNSTLQFVVVVQQFRCEYVNSEYLTEVNVY